MASQFFITLPSNSESSNSTAIFSTKLPININLDGEWEVGLAEIMYGNTWPNINGENNRIKFTDVKSGKKFIWRLVQGRYETVHGLLDAMQKARKGFVNPEKNILLDKFEFGYMENIKRCTLKIDTNAMHDFEAHEDFLYMLGFGTRQFEEIKNNSGEKFITSWHPVDMSCGLNHLYIYCDIVAPQIVGNVQAPLLQVVNVEGNYVDIINKVYIAPHYIPILKKSFNTIEINIRDDRNRPIAFEYGKTIVKLHFKRIQ